jgi:hypothetical protein
MKGDFSRNTFAPLEHYSRVLMQQGRVQLDADWNEQVAILLHYLQTLAADLIGPHGGLPGAFEIQPGNAGDFVIQPGHYYVDGILCENEVLRDDVGNPSPVTYTNQPDYPLREADRLEDGETYMVYLDVWERHVTTIEDTDIREVALGPNGPNTTTRAKVIWQVKTEKDVDHCPNEQEEWDGLMNKWQPPNRGRLKAKAREDPERDTDPCIVSPEARYRGAENQLYRVEIHAGSRDENGNPPTPTFKWSRDNGSVVFPIRSMTPPEISLANMVQPTVTTRLTLEHLGRDGRFGLAVGDWVEIVDDDYVLQRRAEPLWQVEAVDPVNTQVTLKREGFSSPPSGAGQDPSKHPLLRRWDHKEGDPDKRGLELHEGAAIVKEGEGKAGWLILEDGVQIQFQPAPEGTENQYRTGDYWLIPARTATGDVLWPGPIHAPEAVPPHGVEHHYAPLAIILVGSDGQVTKEKTCRRRFGPLGRPIRSPSSRP